MVLPGLGFAVDRGALGGCGLNPDGLGSPPEDDDDANPPDMRCCIDPACMESLPARMQETEPTGLCSLLSSIFVAC